MATTSTSMAAEIPQIAPPNGSTTKKPLYEASTQYRNWRFAPEKLTQIRASLNAVAITIIRTTFEADEVSY